MRHIMYDLETWGLQRGNAIRSITGIPFDPYAGYIAPREKWFYQNVGWQSQELAGLTKNESTVAWWGKSEFAEAAALLEPDQVPLLTALMYHDRWLKDQFGWDSGFDDIRPWARGNMDMEVLEGVYFAANRTFPFNFRAPRDTRNFFDLVEFNHIFQTESFPFEGIPHFGPDDAYHECKQINRIFEICELQRFGPPEYSGFAETIEDDQAQKFAELADVVEHPPVVPVMSALATGSLNCSSNPQMPEGWEPASGNEGDPVGRYKGDWGHWDETWSEWHGGHADEAAARKALQVYCDTVL